MKSLNIILGVCLIIYSSCGYFFGEKHLVEFECNRASIISIQPTKGTHKCQIDRIRNDCNNSSEIFLLFKNNTKLDLKGRKKLFSHDWYDMPLGIKYLPSLEDSLSRNDNKIALQVTFYY